MLIQGTDLDEIITQKGKEEEEKETVVSSEARGESRPRERLRAYSKAETIAGGGGTGK